MVSCKKLSSCVCDDVCNCSCLATLVYLSVKVLHTLLIGIFVHYFISPVILRVTISLDNNPFSLAMGCSVCDQGQVGTCVRVALLLSDVSVGASFCGRVIMYDCLW